MQINLREDFTTDDVAKLLASKDDSEYRQLRITKDGFAYIADQSELNDIDGLLCRWETWTGKGYCGKKASQDLDYVSQIYRDLKQNWPNPKAEFIDF